MSQKIVAAINKFRQDPTSMQAKMKTLIDGIKAMDPKSKKAKRLDAIQRILPAYEPVSPLNLSDDLCKAAEDYLENNAKRGIKNGVIVGDACKKAGVPENYVNENTLIYTGDSYEDPDSAVIHMLSCEDADAKENGTRFLISEPITQVGVATNEGDEEGGFCFIFSEDPALPEEEPEIEGVDVSDLKDLKQAFEDLQTEEGKNRINLKDLIQFIDDVGKEQTNPTLVRMIKELDDGKTEFVSWPQFAEHFYGKLTDNKSKKGREDIYNIMKPNETYESIDIAQLKEINDKYKVGYDDDRLSKMLTYATDSKYGVSFEDYCRNLDNKGAEEGEAPEEDSRKVKRTRK